jgi:predicted HAD superfamily phosphohydrolase YqeG
MFKKVKGDFSGDKLGINILTRASKPFTSLIMQEMWNEALLISNNA